MSSLSYDALTAHVAIVLTRYMLIAMEQRQNEDQRTLGELFFFLVDELADNWDLLSFSYWDPKFHFVVFAVHITFIVMFKVRFC